MKRFLLSGLLCLIASSVVLAGERRYDFQQVELKNGLKVITLEDFSCPIVAVRVWYHVGSKNEEPGRQGFAHMFEHMMFRGTDRLSETAHFDNLRRVGGNTNAHTAFDETVYEEELPSNQLEMALWLEAERMAFLKIDKKGFETERKVVEEELRQAINRPYGRVPEKVLAELFGDQCYGWTPGGQISNLRQAKVEEVSAFWDKYYAPNNATLVVVGAVKHADVQALAKKYFEWIPACPQPPRPEVKLEPQTKARTITIQEDKGPLPILGVIYHTVPEADADQLPLQMLMNALGGGESSRLYVDIVKDQKIAQAAVGAAFAFEKAGLAGAGGVLLPFGDKKQLMKTVKKHIKNAREEGITAAELEKVKNQLRRQQVEGMMTVADKADLLGEYAVRWGDAERINKRLAEIDAVTLEDVKRVAQKYLTKEGAINVSVEPSVGGMVGSLLGGKKDDPDDKPPVDNDGTNRVAKRTGPKADAKRPEGFPDSPPTSKMLDEYPEIAHSEKKLPSGLRVVVVKNPEVPMVSVMLGFKSGAWTETKPGAASFTLDMITKGTKTRDAKKIAEVLESNAIELNGSAAMDTAQVSASALLPKLDLAMELLADVVENATFPKEELDVLRQQAKMGLMISTKTPEYLADRQLRRQLYGDHPYARTVTGELEDVDDVKVEDLKTWWSQNARPDNAVLYLAGDIEPEAGFKLAEKYLSEWKAEGELKLPKLSAIPDKNGTHIYLFDRPGSVQSQIRVGHVSVMRKDPNYFPGVVLSNILGGGFNSRLNKAIRVDKGLTYGARGGISPRRFAGQFTVSTFTKTPTTADTVKAILAELDKIQAGAPTDQELTDTQSFITGSFPGQRETPQATVGDLWMIETEELPADYLKQYLKGVSSTKSDQVQETAKKLIDKSHLAIVVVGEAKTIKADLEKIAPVTVVNPVTAAPEEEKGKEKPATSVN